jgi:hypothetical protein
MNPASFGPFRPQLVGDVAQHRAGLGPIGLQKRLPQCRRYHALLGPGDIGESIAHPMHAAALSAGAEDPANRRFQPLMGVGDDQLLRRAARGAAGIRR